MKTEKIQRPTEKLTRREVEILTLTARGKTRCEISMVLALSEETVKDYLAKILRKLNAVNKANAVLIACVFGLIIPYENAEQINEGLKKYPQTGDTDKKL